MFVVHTSIPLDPTRREEAIDRITELVEQSRDETGTVSYRAMRDLSEPNVVRFFEQFDDVAAAQAHTESAQYREFIEALPELTSGTLETIQFEADDVAVHEFQAADLVE